MLQRRQSRKRLFNVLRQKAGFRLFFSHVDLEQYVLPKPSRRGTSIDFRRQIETVDGMYEFEDSDDCPHLPPLELADKVPRDAVFFQRLDLRQGFLQAIFTSNFKARCNPISDTFSRDCLGCCHQPHVALFSSGFPYGALDPVEHDCETIPD